MILISLLLVLAVERSMRKTPGWHIETHLAKYFDWAQSQSWISYQSEQVRLVIQLALPVVVTFVITQWLVGGFISFILQSILLYLCLGSERLRETYRAFLNAAERGDKQACYLYTEQLGHCTTQRSDIDDSDNDSDSDATVHGKSFGQHLLWLNYQHYAAVILWFAIFGAAGAILYVTSRELYRLSCQSSDERADLLVAWMHILDIVPVRITACGLLLVGHFSRAMPVWLSYLTQPAVPAEVFLTDVASKAEEVEVTDDPDRDLACEPKALVTLAKRNVMLILAVIAMLTMSGVIH
ncbi:beta-lactamase regulator AmpE [Alteromonas sp. AMM-1]|uniref:beta-lactamase regulator AmpE n=1 Tax=Alteromonas sp. AMM-1 TaxID=3394233 RepID=UPI0039A64346